MQTYWAVDEAKKVTEKLVERRTRESVVMEDMWRRAYNMYYAAALSGDSVSGLEFMGDEGELIKTTVNELRSLIRQYISIVTKAKLNFEPITSSSDAVVLSNARVSKALCDYIVDSKKIDAKADKLCESAALFGTGFIAALWRADQGKDVTSAMDGTMIKEGDVDIFNLNVEDVFFDYNVENFDQVDNLEFRVKRNKWVLAALYPNEADKIINSTGNSFANNTNYINEQIESQDNIFVYYWFMKPSVLQPQGRMIVSLEDGTVLVDEINHYERIPVVACIPETFQANMVYGYPKVLDLIPLQESLDTVFSAITTNLSALGIQSVVAPESSGISVKDIGGLQFIQYQSTGIGGNGKIEPLQLTQQAPDAYKFVDMARQYLTELSGLNGALRGAPPPGITSGIALTTLSTNALEFLQSFSKAWQNSIAELMTLTIKIYAIYAKDARQLPIAGKNNNTIAQEFCADDLKNIDRIQFTISNAQQLTTGGRIALGQELLAAGMIKNQTEFFNLISSGSLESLVDDNLDEDNLIKSENDDMREGMAVRALITDDHANHIKQHLILLKDPNLRRKAVKYIPNGQNDKETENSYIIMSAVLSHVAEHEDLIEQESPMMRSIIETGQAAPPQPPMMPGQPPEGGQQ